MPFIRRRKPFGVWVFSEPGLGSFVLHVRRARHEWHPWRRIAKSVHGVARLVQRGKLSLDDL